MAAWACRRDCLPEWQRPALPRPGAADQARLKPMSRYRIPARPVTWTPPGLGAVKERRKPESLRRLGGSG